MSVHIYVNLVRRRVETPTPHYTDTCLKLTIVTHLSFSERIAIANLSSRHILQLQGHYTHRVSKHQIRRGRRAA